MPAMSAVHTILLAGHTCTSSCFYRCGSPRWPQSPTLVQELHKTSDIRSNDHTHPHIRRPCTHFVPVLSWHETCSHSLFISGMRSASVSHRACWQMRTDDPSSAFLSRWQPAQQPQVSGSTGEVSCSMLLPPCLILASTQTAVPCCCCLFTVQALPWHAAPVVPAHTLHGSQMWRRRCAGTGG
jgi:hypothetical protein